MNGRRPVGFVHGCFWHRHGGRAALTAKCRRNWPPKFEVNVARDARSQQLLRDTGWTVLLIRGCETQDAAGLADRLAGALRVGKGACRHPRIVGDTAAPRFRRTPAFPG